MSNFGWCGSGHHSLCPVTVTSFYVDEKNKAHTTGTSRCECSCHEAAK